MYIGYDWHRVDALDTEDGEHEICWPGRAELTPAASRELLDLSWGFTWGAGYATSSAMLLALAMLQRQFGDTYALANYEEFAETVIAQIIEPRDKGPRLSWRMDSDALEMWRHRHLIAQARQKAEAAVAAGKVKAS